MQTKSTKSNNYKVISITILIKPLQYSYRVPPCTDISAHNEITPILKCRAILQGELWFAGLGLCPALVSLVLSCPTFWTGLNVAVRHNRLKVRVELGLALELGIDYRVRVSRCVQYNYWKLPKTTARSLAHEPNLIYLKLKAKVETISIAEPLKTSSICKLPIWTTFGMQQWTSDLHLQAKFHLD